MYLLLPCLGFLLLGTAACAFGEIRVRPTPTPTQATVEGEVQIFRTDVLALEAERDSVVETFQRLSRNMMDMRTQDVFATTDDLAARQRELNTRLLLVRTSNPEIAAVHAVFAIAYRTELEAYELLASSVRSGDSTGMQASLSGVLKADEFYRQAYVELEQLFASVGSGSSEVSNGK